MIKIILIVIIILLIVVPLYQGKGVQYIIDNIKGIITTIAINTPSWVKDLIVKVFSIALKLVKAIFNTIIDVIFQESKKEVKQQFDNRMKNLQYGPNSKEIISGVRIT